MYKRTILLLILSMFWLPTASAQTFSENQRLLFLSVASDATSNVHSILSDGTESKQITDTGNVYYPNWAPDGSSILFVQNDEETDSIILLNLGSSQRIEIIATEDNLLRDNGVIGLVYPIMSPDMTLIAFIGAREENKRTTEIYILDIETDELSRLTNDAAIKKNLQFSPDGSQILFLSDLDTEQEFFTFRIHVIDIHDQTIVKVPNSFPFDPVTPNWLSNDEIIFASILEDWGFYTISLADVEPELFYSSKHLDFTVIQGFDVLDETRQITLSGCNTLSTSCEIYILSIGEDTIRQVTLNDHLDTFPSWQPMVEINN